MSGFFAAVATLETLENGKRLFSPIA